MIDIFPERGFNDFGHVLNMRQELGHGMDTGVKYLMKTAFGKTGMHLEQEGFSTRSGAACILVHINSISVHSKGGAKLGLGLDQKQNLFLILQAYRVEHVITPEHLYPLFRNENYRAPNSDIFNTRPWQSILPLLIRHASFLPREIINPSPLRLQGRPIHTHRSPLSSQIEPTQRIPHSPNLITNARLCIGTHLGMKLLIRPQIHQMGRDRLPIPGADQEPIPAMLHLQRDAPRIRGDDGPAHVQCFGDFDLEALARR